MSYSSALGPFRPIAIYAIATASAMTATTAPSAELEADASSASPMSGFEDITGSSVAERVANAAISRTPELDNHDLAVLRGVPGDDDPTALWIIPVDEDLVELRTTADGIEATTSSSPDSASSGSARSEAKWDATPGSDSSYVDDEDLGPEVVYPDEGDSSDGDDNDSQPGTRAPGSPSFQTPGIGGGAVINADRSYRYQTPKCYSRYSTTEGWLDHCIQWAKMQNDGSSTRDHWILKQYGTCKSNTSWLLTRCYLKSDRNADATGSPALAWEDWAPRSDSEGRCRSKSIGVTVGAVSASGSYDACEKQNVTKYQTPGRFSNSWEYDRGRGRTEREVASQIAVGVQEGKVPKMYISWGIKGFLQCC